MLRRLSAAVVLLVACALALPAVVDAATVTSTLVRGRVFWGMQSAPTFTVFGQLTIYGATPGGRLAVSCRPGGGRTACAVRAVERAVPSAGLVSAERFVKGRRLRPGDVLDVTLTDPQGRRKTVSFTIGRGAVPKRQTRCFAADGTEVACTVGCLVGATVPPGDPCEGAGTRTRIPHSLYRWYARWRPGRTIFTKLRIVGLPAGVDVILLCRTTGAPVCPFGARVLRVRRGFADIAKALKRARFRAGAQFEVQLVRANTTAEIIRFTIRDNRKPKASTLCEGPSDPEPRRC